MDHLLLFDDLYEFNEYASGVVHGLDCISLTRAGASPACGFAITWWRLRGGNGIPGPTKGYPLCRGDHGQYHIRTVRVRV